MEPTRREFLVLCVAALLQGGAGPGRGLASTWSDEIGLEAAAAIGRRYLGLRPRASTRESLTKQILGDRDRYDSSLPDVLMARIRADFRSGRTVEVAGWTLSQTECQLCALVALETNP